MRSYSLIRNIALMFLGVLIATSLLGSIQAESTLTLLFVALVLSLLNSLVKPLLVFFTLPFVIFTFGLGLLVINAILLLLAGQLVPGFIVPSFGSALLGALVISLVNLFINLLLPPRPKFQVRRISQPRKRMRRDDVIDI